MEKMLVCGVAYIIVLILFAGYNYIIFKKKERKIILNGENIERNKKINNIKLKDALIYDYMLLSCISAMIFIIVWFMF